MCYFKSSKRNGTLNESTESKIRKDDGFIMKKTNTTMKKIIAIMMIIATLVSLVACGAAEPAGTTGASNATGNATDSEQMQATGSVPTSEGDKQGENSTGQTGDGTTNTSEATDPSAQASTGDPTTEPGSDKTEPTESSTQPTEPTSQPTTPTQPQPTDPPHQHDYSTTTVVAPTCNDKGYTKHTCSCGDSYKDNYTDALGHHFIDEVVAPTSTEKGYTKHTCDRCWYSYNDNYTDPVKQVYDINKAMEVGNAYALSIGFACIDYSLTPANAGYYPPTYSEGRIIEMVGGQEWLEGEIVGLARSCKNKLEALHGEGIHNGCVCRAYIIYDAAEDAYTIYFLYA